MRIARMTLFSILAVVSVYHAAFGQAVKGSLLGASGWQVSGIFSAQSGTPINFTEE